MFRNPCLISLVSILKLHLSIHRFNTLDDELTHIYPPLSFRIWYLLIHYKNGEIRLENRVTYEGEKNTRRGGG